jgi:large subunit ribosomal protein L22e
LSDRIKVDGKTGQVGNAITLARDARTHEIKVTAKPPFSKRYLKYLTKKFLKKQQLRDYIRVIADDKGSYQLKYFNVANEEEES